MSFQTTVNITQAPALEGEASLNPRYILPAAEAGYRAGSGGVTIGRFAWADAAASTLVNTGTAAPNCVIAREFGAAMITTYGAEYGNTIPEGFGVPFPLMAGDVWVKNTGVGSVTVGMKAYAKQSDGTVIFDATSQSHAGYVETKWTAATPAGAGELVKITSVALS